MNIHRLDLIPGLILSLSCSVSTFAADMMGNPADIGQPGQFKLELGGGKSYDFQLDEKHISATTQIGTVSTTHPPFTSMTKIQEDQIFLGATYNPNTSTQIFAHLGTGKDVGQLSNTRSIGIKIAPTSDSSSLRMGLSLRMLQASIKSEGDFHLPSDYSIVSDGINNIYTGAPINGTDEIKYSRFDAFFGISRNTGVFRPYGGFYLTQASGTESVSMDDTVLTNSYPVGGGVLTSSTQRVTFKAKSDITNRNIFAGVLGMSFMLDNGMSMNAELQSGVQNLVAIAGSMGF